MVLNSLSTAFCSPVVDHKKGPKDGYLQGFIIFLMGAESVGCISCIKSSVRPLRYVEKESAFNALEHQETFAYCF